MKKALLLVVALTIGGATFAQNAPYGLDIAWGLGLGSRTIVLDYEGIPEDQILKPKYFEISLPFLLPTKITTYDIPWVNNHIGIYGGIGFLPTFAMSLEEGGGVELDLAFEFMIGPAFGVDMGSTRFQTGVAFHGIIATGWGIGGDGVGSMDYSGFGFALTPQFRFGANKPVSFILGCDFAFDFAYRRTMEGINYSGNSTKLSTGKDGFRFAATPYIGLGINFKGKG